jgi:hypothetical protein
MIACLIALNAAAADILSRYERDRCTRAALILLIDVAAGAVIQHIIERGP